MRDTHESIEATLHEDDVHVVRHQVERDYGIGEIPAGAFQDMEIEIPLRGEEVEVRKRPVICEAVIVSKVLHERGLPVTETLRREEVRIDGDYLDDEQHDVRLERGRSGRSL